MTGSEANGAAPGPSQAGVPEGLVPAVVNLVGTGPVLLGAYTVAELTAVDAIVDFLEARPSDEGMAEAVRSLAARQLLGPRGGPAARPPGMKPGEPGGAPLLPPPEPICLMVRIDGLGIHELGLYQMDEALQALIDWLPRGSAADRAGSGNADKLLGESERSALVTVTRYTAR